MSGFKWIILLLTLRTTHMFTLGFESSQECNITLQRQATWLDNTDYLAAIGEIRVKPNRYNAP